MPRCVTKLRIHTRDPLTREQLHQFAGDKHGTRLVGRLGGHDLRATVFTDSYDPLGAATRAVSYVLDRIPGELVGLQAEVSD